jgi:PAS domain S-box-containing protein
MTNQLTAAGFASMANASILMDHPDLGCIRIFSRASNTFSPEHAEILAEVANQLAIAISQTRMREQIQKHTAELEEHVRERTTQVQDLYDNAPVGYHSVDANGILVSINQTALNWLGYARDELVGKHHACIFAPQVAPALAANFERSKQEGVLNDFESIAQRKDGTRFPVMINSIAIYDAQGQYQSNRSTMADITVRKQAERSLQESRDALNTANRELARAAKLKDEFLANMSHELRTPLNAILGLTEGLSEQMIGPLNERQLSALAVVETSGKHLLTLINDILDLSKIEAGGEALHMTSVSVSSVCETSLTFIKQTAHKKQIKVSATLDQSVKWITADERRLKQMLVNLLTNAVKFTPERGRVELHVLGDAANKTASFSVRDTGIGIAPQDITNLFKPFVQVDGSLTRQYEGTGLGLALVARMAEMHGGSVSVESEVGRGSCFTLILPWTDEMHLDPTASIHVDPLPSISSMPTLAESETIANAPLVLIAEDNEANILTVSSYLKAKGFRVNIAQNGQEALEIVHVEQPAVILMDLQMPVLDGLETTRRLRQDRNAQISKIPIIALTALAMPGDRERALTAGANEYISKPANMKHLIELINRLVQSP